MSVVPGRRILLNHEGIRRSPEEQGALMTLNPSIQMYYNLQNKIATGDTEWLLEFLDLDGLENLLESLEIMTRKDSPSFADSILEIDCLGCVREVMNRPLGMQWMVGRREYVINLTKALESSSGMTKKQVFEMLTAICAYSCHGYQLVLDALNEYKLSSHRTDHWSVVMCELKSAETVPNRTCLISFINTLLYHTEEPEMRTRMRTELQSLQLLDVLAFMRKEEKDEDLCVQLEAFYSLKHEDDILLQEQNCTTKDMGDVKEVFAELSNRFHGRPESVYLLHILQDLLRLTTGKENKSNTIKKWDIISQAVHTTVGLEESELAKQTDPERQVGAKIQNIGMNHRRLNKVQEPYSVGYNTQINGCIETNTGADQMEEIVTTKPRYPLRMVKWEKVTVEEVRAAGPLCLWHPSQGRAQPIKSLDLQELKKLFKISNPGSKLQCLSPPHLLQLHLFLTRTGVHPPDLVDAIKVGDALDEDVMRYLIQVLPPQAEVEFLRGCHLAPTLMSPAEQFMLALSQVPGYPRVLQARLFRAEFPRKMAALTTSVEAMRVTCKDLLESKTLKTFLKMVLETGNFLNYGQCLGQAPGFRLCSLVNLSQVLSSTPQISLLHHLVQCCSGTNALAFVDGLKDLDTAARSSIETLRSDFNQLNSQLQNVLVWLRDSSEQEKKAFDPFLRSVRESFRSFQSSVMELRQLSSEVARYFCEIPDTFDIHTCLQAVNRLCQGIKRCKKENAQFALQRQLAHTRKAELCETLALRRMANTFGTKAGANSTVIESESDHHSQEGLVEFVLNEIHHSNFRPAIPLHLQPQGVTPGVDEVDNPLLFSEIKPDPSYNMRYQGMQERTGSVVSLASSCHQEEEPVRPRWLHRRSRSDLTDAVNTVTLKQHRRSKSDLTAALSTVEKWMKSESSLNLEKRKETWLQSTGAPGIDRKTAEKLSHDHLYQPGAPDEVTKPRQRKRSSLGGVFDRLSKAVMKSRNQDQQSKKKGLRQRDTNIQRHSVDNQQSTKPKLKTKTEKQVVKNKENLEREKIITEAEKRYALRVYQRFKASREVK